MKTHDLAEALKMFAMMLKRSPNIDVNDLAFIDRFSTETPSSKRRSKKDDLPVALSALLSLSRIDKREWVELISDLGLSLEINPRDSSRDVVGKVLRLLEKDAHARELLATRVQSKQAQASPELMNALSSLLRSN